LVVAQVAEGFSTAAGITSLAALYFGAVAVLLATRQPTRRAVLATEPDLA
jgi:NAD(P)H-hydrate repair Nnr-like enzyme with NAD(P)H-hydrate dehydratase domain